MTPFALLVTILLARAVHSIVRAERDRFAGATATRSQLKSWRKDRLVVPSPNRWRL